MAWRRSTPFEVEALELDTLWLRSTFGYTASRWLRVEALYTFTRQDSIVTAAKSIAIASACSSSSHSP